MGARLSQQCFAIGLCSWALQQDLATRLGNHGVGSVSTLETRVPALPLIPPYLRAGALLARLVAWRAGHMDRLYHCPKRMAIL